MRVVINQCVALGNRTGIGHYCSQLLRCLAGLTPHTFTAFPGGCLKHIGQKFLKHSGSGHPHASTKPKHFTRGLLRSAARFTLSRCFQAACAFRNYDLYHEPNYIPLPSDLPTVATVHDLSVLMHPEWHPPDRVAHFEKHFERALRQCQHVLAISEAGRQEIMDKLGIAPHEVTRTYMGIHPGLQALPADVVEAGLRSFGLRPGYLLFLGTIEPRKNLAMLLRAYCALPAPLRSAAPLVLAGRWGWQADEVAGLFDREARHRGVIHLGYVPDECLGILYNGARALVYPSLYEGFGLPPIEMMACGGAVLASTADALVETVGSKAHLIAASDLDGWRQGMARVIQDADWRDLLRQGVERVARKFTWEQCATDTLHAYGLACGQADQAVDRAGESLTWRKAG